MSNKGKLNQVILVHPNTYYLMLEDQLSSEFISRKLIPYLNDKSISDFNKWIMIKQELNIFMKRKNRPIKPALENNKSVVSGDVHFNSESVNQEFNTNLDNSTDKAQSDNFDKPEKLQKKQQHSKFYDEIDFNENSLNDLNKVKRKLDYEGYPNMNNETSLQETPNNELKQRKLSDETSTKPSSKNKKGKRNKKGNESKSSSKHQYNTRSVQKGESWNKWVSLY